MNKEVMQALETALEPALADAFKFGFEVRQLQKDIQDGINVLSRADAGQELHRESVVAAKKRYDVAVKAVHRTYERSYSHIPEIAEQMEQLNLKHARLIGVINDYSDSIRSRQSTRTSKKR